MKKILLTFVICLSAAGTANATLVTLPQSDLHSDGGFLYSDTIGGGIGNIVLGRNDDGYTPALLGFDFSFEGHTYSSFYINNNGNVSFQSGNSAYVPTGPIGATSPTIALFFSDVDTRNALSGVVHLRTDIPHEIIVTWDHVGYFNTYGSPLNTFQLILRDSNYVVPTGQGNIGFYYGSMGWTSTDTSRTAAVGFGDGAGNGEIIAGSNSQLDFHTALNNQYIWFDPQLNVVPTPPTPTNVPEPASLALLCAGLYGLIAVSRKKIAIPNPIA